MGASAENLRFREVIDKQFLEKPWYGSRQMVQQVAQQMARLVPIYQEPNTSRKHPQHKIWPYLLEML